MVFFCDLFFFWFLEKSSNVIFCWVGQQRTPMLVQPHSKIILRDGIKSDTEFLSKSNIMDYSYVCLFFSMKFFVHGLFSSFFLACCLESMKIRNR